MLSHLHICHSTFGHSVNPDFAACAMHCAAMYALCVAGAAISGKFLNDAVRLAARHAIPAMIGSGSYFLLTHGGFA